MENLENQMQNEQPIWNAHSAFHNYCRKDNLKSEGWRVVGSSFRKGLIGSTLGICAVGFVPDYFPLALLTGLPALAFIRETIDEFDRATDILGEIFYGT